jgi:hypothetical protein
MPKGLKVFFTVLIVLVLVIAVPILQMFTLMRATIMRPSFYGRQMSGIYEEAYDMALEMVSDNMAEVTGEFPDEAGERLNEAIRTSLPREDVTEVFSQSLPTIVNYILYGGDVPVIDYSPITEGVEEALWTSNMFQDMISGQIMHVLEDNGWVLTDAPFDEAYTAVIGDIFGGGDISEFYSADKAADAEAVLAEAVQAGMEGESIDLSALPLPDKVDLVPMEGITEMLPFSPAWDPEGMGDLYYQMDRIHYFVSVAQTALLIGWIGAVVLVALLFLVWFKKSSIFMGITGTLLLIDGAGILLFAVSSWIAGTGTLIRFIPVPQEYAGIVRMGIQSVTRPFGIIGLVVGVLAVSAGIVLLIVKRVVKKKELAKEQAA